MAAPKDPKKAAQWRRKISEARKRGYREGRRKQPYPGGWNKGIPGSTGPRPTGPDHHSWQPPGSRYIDVIHGYLKIKRKDGTWDFEHRVVMERKLGRRLTSDEVVHHINGDTLDNRACNLELTTRSGHVDMHRDALDEGRRRARRRRRAGRS